MIKSILKNLIRYLTILLFKIDKSLIAYSFSNCKDLCSDFTLKKNTYDKNIGYFHENRID